MADTYASVIGFVQFQDAEVKDINGSKLTEFAVRAIGFQGQPIVKVAAWHSNFDASELEGIKKGDLIAADGKYRQSSNQEGSRIYHNLTAYSLARTPVVTKLEREPGVANATTTAAGSGAALPF